MEGQQYGYMNEDFASVAGAVGLVADRVSRLEAVGEQMGPPFAGVEDATEEELDRLVHDYRAQVGGPRHWGIWHPDRSWWQLEDGRVFITTERIVAEAQRDAIEYGGREKAPNLSFYRVRCIEEWADEQSS